MKKFTLKASEKKFLEFIILDYLGERLPITGATIHFQVQKYGESTLRLDATAELINPSQGECRYYYSGALPVGEYKGELEIEYSSLLRPKTETFYIKVIPDLPS